MLIGALLGSPLTARGQLLSDQPNGPSDRLGEPTVGQFLVGAEITGRGGTTKNLVTMVAVPLECAEQQVKVISEDFSSNISKVTYRNVRGGLARQMVVSIPKLASGEKAWAKLTFEVATRPQLPLEDSEAEQLSLPKKIPSKVRRYMAASPFIESRHRNIRSLSAEILDEIPADTNDWQKVEGLYDYVLENINYLEGPDTSALTTLRDGEADCHGRSALFVALCRAAGYPARMVWVNGHCYAEFYLEDTAGEGRWLPIESAGSRAFGEMPLARVILQKGDSFSVPEKNREKLRYATDFARARSGKPKIRFIREQL